MRVTLSISSEVLVSHTHHESKDWLPSDFSYPSSMLIYREGEVVAANQDYQVLYTDGSHSPIGGKYVTFQVYSTV